MDISVRHRLAGLRSRLNVIIDMLQQEFAVAKEELWTIEGTLVYQEFRQQLAGDSFIIHQPTNSEKKSVIERLEEDDEEDDEGFELNEPVDTDN